jgi:hypothetical protein
MLYVLDSGHLNLHQRGMQILFISVIVTVHSLLGRLISSSNFQQ